MGKVSSKLCAECLMPFYKRFSTVKLQEEDVQPMMSDTPKSSQDEDCFFSKTPIDEVQETVESNDNSNELNLLLDIMSLAKEEFLAYTRVPLSHDGCEELVNKDSCIVYGKDLPGGFLLKAEWMIPYTGKEFIDFFQDIEERPKWDTNISQIKIISQPSQYINTTYTTFKKVLTISPRDLILTSAVFETNDGILLVSKSMENQEFPEKEEFVRMNIELGGYFIQSITETTDGMKSKVFNITKGDFGGSLPKRMIKKMTAMALPGLTKSILKAMKKKSELEL
ncbi:unnamed protein product [Blepharisma stoltei]|uniref:START domain-containing protein n=1 Tax=Blepharisma stoltei TaxID=1481888 RepID=A0AAU9K2C7_9CILI|nr:unnamed protein product [Blepharisma stoltei]